MAAGRTGTGHRATRIGPVAFRIAAATVEDSPLPAARNDLSVAAGAGAPDPGGKGSGRLAGRIVRTGEEASEAPGLHHHRASAGGAWRQVRREGNRGGGLSLGRPGTGCLAGGIVAAGQEGPEAPLPHDHGFAAGLADLSRGLGQDLGSRSRFGLDDISGRLAGGIVAAGEIGPVAPPLLDHEGAADRTGNVGGLALGLEVGHPAALRTSELGRKRAIEVVDGLPIDLVPLLDGVELLLHPGGKGHVEEIGEAVDQKAVDRLAELRRVEAVFPLLHVLPVEDGGHDGRIGTGAADPLLLELPNQGGLVVAGRGLSEVL